MSAKDDDRAVLAHDKFRGAAFDDEFLADDDLLELTNAFQRGLADIRHLADADPIKRIRNPSRPV